MACVVVTTTVGSKEKAASMARALVSRKFAACVQILPVASVYRWKGELAEEQEVLLLIKTTSERYPSVQDWISQHHDYEVPEILCTEVTAGWPAYTGWIEQSVDDSKL